VFTLPELAFMRVPVPSILSVHEAPDSEYADHWTIVRFPDHIRVTTGRVTSRVPMKVIPEATILVEILPEYTTPL
jgi:hypothetical protein